MVSTKKRSKEYFAESVYGVKASPRVTNRKSNLPRGGGRDQIGKPYKVRGKMYYPKEEKGYKKTGLASWYGDAFHGRLTANGEIYDMTHLTGAHPTMPLPSYARVTNVENGSSVIVRINDRGPYHANRLIDLSHKAADLLGYTTVGTAKVKVEYVGRAPLEGKDDQYLIASYRPGNAAPDPSDGLPTGVMIAMNGPTPSASVSGEKPAVAFPGTLSDTAPQPVVALAQAGFPELPAFGPIAPERPAVEGAPQVQVAMLTMSYAQERVSAATRAFDILEGGKLDPASIQRSWTRMNDAATVPATTEPFVAAGTFGDAAEAENVRRALSAFGSVDIETSQEAGSSIYSVNLRGDGRATLDAMLAAAWENGAPDAILVRD